jgi:hypothetical protein
MGNAGGQRKRKSSRTEKTEGTERERERKVKAM